MRLNIKSLSLTSILTSFCLFSHNADTQEIHFNDSEKRNVITPATGPTMYDGIGVIFTADFLYWAVKQDGLGYVQENFGDGTTTVTRSELRNVNGRAKPGFKVGLGYQCPRDGWDLLAEYTWIYTHDSQRRTGANFYPVWNIANLFNNHPSPVPGDLQIAEAQADWHLHFHVVDLTLQRKFYISNNLTLMPHVGLKGSWQMQDLNVTYIPTDISQLHRVARMKNDQDMLAIGIRTGLGTIWKVIYDLGFFGDFALAGMWSYFDVERIDTEQDTLSFNPHDLPVKIFNLTNRMHGVKPVFEYTLGLNWETWFSDNNYYIALSAGWEQQIWFGQNQLLHLMEEAAHGSLTTQGLTVKFRFDF